MQTGMISMGREFSIMGIHCRSYLTAKFTPRGAIPRIMSQQWGLDAQILPIRYPIW